MTLTIAFAGLLAWMCLRMVRAISSARYTKDPPLPPAGPTGRGPEF